MITKFSSTLVTKFLFKICKYYINNSSLNHVQTVQVLGVVKWGALQNLKLYLSLLGDLSNKLS